MHDTYDALALFSCGLDSGLACKVVREQGLRVLGLHFTTPFFGDPQAAAHWGEVFGVDVLPVDVGRDYVRMMLDGPKFGFGKCLNPCMDCKVFMLRKARRMLAEYKAKFLVSGEVLGQRPMSQRLDALNAISREAGVRKLLLRPLSARFLDPTPMEESGLIDRERLPLAKGRGRKVQMELAERFGLSEIPSPAGGCSLAEKELTARYHPLLNLVGSTEPEDYALVREGRQFWNELRWLCVGRNRTDNDRLESLARPGDLLFRLRDVPGPLGLGRAFAGHPFDESAVASAAALVASYSPRAVKSDAETVVCVASGDGVREVAVRPAERDQSPWGGYAFQDYKDWRKSQNGTAQG